MIEKQHMFDNVGVGCITTQGGGCFTGAGHKNGKSGGFMHAVVMKQVTEIDYEGEFHHKGAHTLPMGMALSSCGEVEGLEDD